MVVIALAAAATGCGDDEPDTTTAPAVEETTGSEAGSDVSEPGAPDEGEPDYTGLGTWWAKLPSRQRVASAAEFIDDFPSDCKGVKPVELEQQTGIAYGYDFPDATPVDAVMIETCALIRDGA
jgi:hypothetical protein